MKIILLTGSTGKLGKIFFSYLVSAGYKVVCLTRSADEAIKKLKISQCPIASTNIEFIETDLSTPNCVHDITRFCRIKKLHISHIINAARDLQNIRPANSPEDQFALFQREFAIGVSAPYLISEAISKEQNGKLEGIINISSQYGIVAHNKNLYDNPDTDYAIHYGVTKSAIIHLTKEMAVRYAKNGTRVNCIAYGGIKGRVSKEFEERYSNFVPSKRMLDEKEVLPPLKFLLDENNTSTTGQCIVVDGGWTIW